MEALMKEKELLGETALADVDDQVNDGVRRYKSNTNLNWIR